LTSGGVGVVSGWQQRVVAATVEVLVDGRREASGVLVDGRHVLTARHVVAVDRPVEVVFPAGGQPLSVQVVALPGAEGVDVAVLHLSAGRAPTVPVELSPLRRLPHEVEVFGFPRAEKQPTGVWRPFAVSKLSTAGTVQLGWEDAGTLPGHSGGPVVDGEGRLVGILVEGSAAGRFDRFVPLGEVERVWAGLRRPWLVAGEGARAHLESRATGRLPGSGLRGGDLFRGRAVALGQIAGWISAERPPGRVLVVTPAASITVMMRGC
jgi:S1-C subfamily serine protease